MRLKFVSTLLGTILLLAGVTLLGCKREDKAVESTSTTGTEYLRVSNQKAKAESDADSAYRLCLDDPKAGMAKLVELAESGNNIASFRLYMIYDSGDLVKVKPNKDAAMKWLKVSAKDGHITAEYLMGINYLTGQDGVKKNVNKGIALLESSASKGNVYSMYELAKEHFIGKRIKEDKIKGEYYLKQAADNGFGEALYEYAFALYEGKLVAKDLEKAAEYCAEAVSKDVKNSKALMAHIKIEILESKPVNDYNAYELGKEYLAVGQSEKARRMFRFACYGEDESDDRNPQSPACMAYYRLETRL